MKLSVEEILDRVKRVKDTRVDGRWAQCERMYNLDAGFPGTLSTDIMAGRERVISPRPKNTVNIAKWNVGTAPQVKIPPAGPGIDEGRYADKCEQWLVAAWQRNNEQQQTNVIQNAFHTEFITGEHFFEVKWPDRSKSPKVLKDRLFPITVRALHPSAGGVWRGPDYVEYGFVNIDTTLIDVLQRYPDLKYYAGTSNTSRFREKLRSYLRKDDMRGGDKVELLEIYWVGMNDGAIWGALLVDDVFALEPKESEYPLVPFVSGSGNNNESLLAASDGLWQAECRLMSYFQTAVMHNAFVNYLYQSETGEPMPDIDWGKGGITQIPVGSKVDPMVPNINVPVFQAMLGIYGQMLDQSSFPGVTSGQVSGSVQAGYAIQNLQESAIGRIEPHRQAVERSVAYVNQLMLAYVDHIGPKRGYKDGVSIWGRSERDGNAFRVTLTKEMIDGYYENAVTLRASSQQDDIAKMNMTLQWFNAGLVSTQSARDKGVPEMAASDEQERINLDKLMNSEQMTPVVMVMTAWQQVNKDKELMTIYVDQDPTWRAIAEKLGYVDPLPPPPPPPQEGSPILSGMPGGPPPMGAMPPMRPELMNPVGGGPLTGGGMPPAMVGGLEGENIGLSPDAPAFITQPALGNQMTDQELLDSLLAAGQI